MIRLHVVVEGDSEETFVRELLAPHLSAFGVFPVATRVSTKRQRGKTWKGGGHRYARWKRDLALWMKRDGGPEARFTTMIDLYSLPAEFPGQAQCATIADVRDRVRCLETKFAEDMANDRRFIPYIQIHEFEALLFARVESFRAAFPALSDSLLQKLAGIRSQFGTVEDIDDGQHSAPSKRIKTIVPQFDKVTGGNLIALDIGVQTMRMQSPHFDEWIARLEVLDQPQI